MTAESGPHGALEKPVASNSSSPRYSPHFISIHHVSIMVTLWWIRAQRCPLILDSLSLKIPHRCGSGQTFLIATTIACWSNPLTAMGWSIWSQKSCCWKFLFCSASRAATVSNSAAALVPRIVQFNVNKSYTRPYGLPCTLHYYIGVSYFPLQF